MKAEISRCEVSPISPDAEWLRDSTRTVRWLPRRAYEPDADAITTHGTTTAAMIAYLRAQESFTASLAPIVDTVPEDQWLFAERPLPTRTSIHTFVFLYDCTDTERAQVFKAVTR
ncbi:hypothetical protein [Nocardia alni]|uniref:hypothetical protein n=1 Tax=Nocardia alni TaxID=2815723 RepID=UPI001C22257C|nr:hypothetical protein [Nocardia alni]